MNEYTPDRWVMLEITGPNNKSIRKIFAGWSCGFAGDSWRLNSGITATRTDDQGHYEFDGNSGSIYCCHANDYGMNSYMQQVLESWRENMPHVDFKEIELDEIVES
jgi:hypothetical protein